MRNRIFILVMVMAQAVAVHAQMPPWLPAHTDVATAELVTVFGNFEVMVTEDPCMPIFLNTSREGFYLTKPVVSDNMVFKLLLPNQFCWGAPIGDISFNVSNYITSTAPADTKLIVKGSTGRVGVNTTNPQAQFHVNGNSFLSGNVGIGINNTTPNVKLDVAGIVRAYEVKVCLNQGCDYVFAQDYKLMSLSELEQYIAKNKHLPEVAPAAEMEAEGINVSEMSALLLKKVEELTLYIIELEKRLAELEAKKGGK